jgi:hypothetical protein
MKEELEKLSMQELMDRLAELSDSLSAGRGHDKAHADCKIKIDAVQCEIELRKNIRARGSKSH